MKLYYDAYFINVTLLESVAVKCPKSELWIVVSRVSILKLTDFVNFPAKKLDEGRFCI